MYKQYNSEIDAVSSMIHRKLGCAHATSARNHDRAYKAYKSFCVHAGAYTVPSRAAIPPAAGDCQSDQRGCSRGDTFGRQDRASTGWQPCRLGCGRCLLLRLPLHKYVCLQAASANLSCCPLCNLNMSMSCQGLLLLMTSCTLAQPRSFMLKVPAA